MTARHCVEASGGSAIQGLTIERPQFSQREGGGRVVRIMGKDLVVATPAGEGDVAVIAFLARDDEVGMGVLGRKNMIVNASPRIGEKVRALQFPGSASRMGYWVEEGWVMQSKVKERIENDNGLVFDIRAVGFAALAGGGGSGAGWFNDTNQLIAVNSFVAENVAGVWGSVIPWDIDQMMMRAERQLRNK